MFRFCALCIVVSSTFIFAGEPWQDQLERVGCVLWDNTEEMQPFQSADNQRTQTKEATQTQQASFQADLCNQEEAYTTQPVNALELDYHAEVESLQNYQYASLENRMSCLEREFNPRY